MADILGIGTSALTSLQQAITTTGHNIANVNTDGYSRQRVQFDTLPPQFFGGNYLGSGVEIGAVERTYDRFLTGEVRNRTSSLAEYTTLQELSGRLDNLLADPAAGLTASLDGFFSALQDVANNPGSLSERQILLGQAQNLSERFDYLDGRMRGLNEEMNARIETSVSEINNLSRSIADINQEIAEAGARTNGSQPNDLLDSRDELLRELAQKVGISTVQQSDGSINVLMGNGQPLVIGGMSEALSVVPNPNDNSQLIVGRRNPSGSVDDLSRFVVGGELGAVVEFRNQGVTSGRSQLGLIAAGITATVNEQHRLGIDLNGDLGGDLFAPLEPNVSAYTTNSGASSVLATIDDVNSLTGDDYSVRFDGAQWTVTNLSTQASQSGAGPFTLDGLTIDVAGAPTNGDTFVVQPTATSAAQFSLAITDPTKLAVAGPLRSPISLTNAGTGEVSGLQVNDTAGLPLGGPITLTFNPDALGAGVPGFDVAGIAGGPLAFDPVTQSSGASFTLGGFEFEVSGDPIDGDVLRIENNTDGSGDNRNALALAGLQSETTLRGGTATYQDAYGSLISDIALQSRRAQNGADTEGALLSQAEAARNSVSGVNLDEEAANLIRYQQAYQAAAQVISVAEEMFQVLLNATGR